MYVKSSGNETFFFFFFFFLADSFTGSKDTESYKTDVSFFSFLCLCTSFLFYRAEEPVDNLNMLERILIG